MFVFASLGVLGGSIIVFFFVSFVSLVVQDL